MATQTLPLILALALALMALASSEANRPHHEPAKKAAVPAVEGVVYCQNCSYVGTSSLTDARFLPFARVLITCKEDNHRVVFATLVTANANGYFFAALDGGIEDAVQMCTAKLASSADARCKFRTNITGGIDGSPLRDEDKLMYDINYYATGPFAFKPADCPKPRY